ncbi:hypothetical protein [Arenimonas sp.]|uniref:CsbD family protein n=1 Tax=Arenimonas sp. TaxID=1872635 RepID=UPI0025FD9D57|nr:hypothetical protein [Arenimonas sp.]
MDDTLDTPHAPAQPASPVAEPRARPGSFPGPQHPWRRPAGALARWKKRLGEAKATWPLTTIDELIATDGHVQKLAGLIQERYGLSHEAAELQAGRFLGRGGAT